MKKVLIAVVLIVLLIPAAVLIGIRLPVFGAHPDELDRASYQRSSAFNVDKGIFQNRRAELFQQMREGSSTIGMLKEWFTERADGTPASALPEVKPDMQEFVNYDGSAKIIWLGHSSFLLNLAGSIILIDPVFSAYAAPVSFTAQRFQPPVIALSELPPIDIVLISHDHYDHLDMATIEFFQNYDTEFVVPLGVGLHLKRWGIEELRITERDWWESTSSHDIEFTAAPAQHFSGRDGINNNETLWASWSIVSNDARLFFSGDSGYDTHFEEIGRRLGPFDIAFMENGQYNEAWKAVHMMPGETLLAFNEVNASRLMPIHWGMFELAFHTWYDPVVQLQKLADDASVDLLTPRIGEVFHLDGEVAESRWWESETQ